MSPPPSRASGRARRGAAAPHTLRVTGGARRGLTLEGPADDRIRPTADRTRQAVFNLLAHRGDDGDAVRDAIVLDAFAGTGALAIEALSRGAASATLMDRDTAAAALVHRNLVRAGLGDRARLVPADATRPPAPAGAGAAGADLVFLDPPYGQGLVAPALSALDRAGWIGPAARVVVETDRADPVPRPDGWQVAADRRYGRARIQLWWRG